MSVGCNREWRDAMPTSLQSIDHLQHVAPPIEHGRSCFDRILIG